MSTVEKTETTVTPNSEVTVTTIETPTGSRIERAYHKGVEHKHEAKYLRLTHITYTDENGVDRQWDCVERTTRKGQHDGVDIIAIVRSSVDPKVEPRLVLTTQYRPPLRGYAVEFPAGLIDDQESVQDAALRELREET